MATSAQLKQIQDAQNKLIALNNSGKVTQADITAYQNAVKAAGGTPVAKFVTAANDAIKAAEAAAARDKAAADKAAAAKAAADKAAADKAAAAKAASDKAAQMQAMADAVAAAKKAAADKLAAEKAATAKAAADKLAAEKAAADKLAADKAAAEKAAATAAATAAKLGEKYTSELTKATTQAQLDDIKARAAAEGATINAGVLDNATKAVVQKEAAVVQAAQQQKTDALTQELTKATTQEQVNSVLAKAAEQGVQLNQGYIDSANTVVKQTEAAAAEAAQQAAAAPFLEELTNVTTTAQLADLQSRAEKAGVTLNAGQLERAQTGVQQAEAAAAKEAQAETERAAAAATRSEKLATQQQAAYDYASKLVAPTSFQNKFTPGGVELQGVPDDPTTPENESGWYAQTPDGLQKIGSDGKPTGPVIPGYDEFNARADQIRTNTAAFEQAQQADQAALAATTLAKNSQDFEAALPTPADFLATGKSMLRGPDGSEYSLTPANLATGAPQQWIKQNPDTQAITNLSTGTTVNQSDYRDTLKATDAANSQVALEQRAALGAAQREEAAGPDFGDFAKVLAVAAIATIAAPYVASMFSGAGAGALSATEAASTAASMAEAGASAGEIAGALEAAGLESAAASAVAETATGIAAGTVDAASIAATSVTPEMLTAAGQTLDPIAALNAGAGWAPVDTGYLASIGASPELVAVGEATNIGMGLDAAGLNILSEAETLQLMQNIDPNMISSLAPTTAGTAGGTSSMFAGEILNPISNLASSASELGSMFTGSSINPISNLVANAGITNPILAGALTGAGTGAVINLATGQPITGQSLALGALGGGVAGGIGSVLPDMGTGMLGSGLAGAATNVGATAVVSLITGQPITTDSLAGAALIGGAVGAGSQAVSDAFGNTTYNYEDGSSLTVNSKGTPVTVTDNTGANVPVAAVDTRTGQTKELPPVEDRVGTPVAPSGPPAGTIPVQAADGTVLYTDGQTYYTADGTVTDISNPTPGGATDTAKLSPGNQQIITDTTADFGAGKITWDEASAKINQAVRNDINSGYLTNNGDGTYTAPDGTTYFMNLETGMYDAKVGVPGGTGSGANTAPIGPTEQPIVPPGAETPVVVPPIATPPTTPDVAGPVTPAETPTVTPPVTETPVTPVTPVETPVVTPPGTETPTTPVTETPIVPVTPGTGVTPGTTPGTGPGSVTPGDSTIPGGGETPGTGGGVTPGAGGPGVIPGIIPGPVTPGTEVPEITITEPRLPVVPPIVVPPVVPVTPEPPPVVEPPVTPEPPVVEPPVVTPPVYPPIYVPPVTEPPVKKTGFDPLGPYTPVTLPPLSNTGTNPGWFTNVPAQYQTNDMQQSKFYWGKHPFQTGERFSPEQYQQVNAPVAPWGLQQMYNPQTQTIEALLQGVKAASATAPYNLPAAPKV